MKPATLLAYLCGFTATGTQLWSQDFRIHIDDSTGALWEIFDPSAESHMNWISGPLNAPWQPTGSRWGMGFADLGDNFINRAYWSHPTISSENSTHSQAVYKAATMELIVTRKLDTESRAFTETYKFRNSGESTLDLAHRSEGALAIYTPFNDHYVNTTDSLSSRAHAHVWANGGSSSWVKWDQMGGHNRNLGLVLTKGTLVGYSIESRDTVSYSNTRGVFALHPHLPQLRPQEETEVEWTFFWHDDWDDFFDKCLFYSTQFIGFNVSSYTLFSNESATIDIIGGGVDSKTTINGDPLECSSNGCVYVTEGGNLGQKDLHISTSVDGEAYNSTIFLNSVPNYEDLIQARVRFIVENQQITDPGSPIYKAYVVYDNQLEKMVTFDSDRDRNAGRERVGMGVLIGRWLATHSDAELESSLARYYEFVCTKLQDDDGYVLDGPGSRSKRLYNWPWVMQLHLVVAALDLDLPKSLGDKSPLDRFVLTLENYYSEGGHEFYTIGLPILEGLRALEASDRDDDLMRALALFTKHAEYISDRGVNYPSFEVNFEQSIVGPATNILLEIHRWTHDYKWLEAAEVQLQTLMRFAGKQPDYRMHNVAIRHWDGYWFGKDRMWGDTFPHYWSTISALALHHYGKIKDVKSYEHQAEGIIRANLALFTPQGEASCAWIYPLSVNGREGHYPDPYANDQDWALAHLLQIQADNAYSVRP